MTTAPVYIGKRRVLMAAVLSLVLIATVMPLFALAQTSGTSGTAAASPATQSLCSGSSYGVLPNFLLSPVVCTGRLMGALVDGLLVYISSWILTLAGMLFNWLILHTIVQFGTFYSGIQTAIETTWTAFRDIANILIIGMFTFISISMILGLKEYGDKKLIAKVLMIAVFINFSLLFTKIIIDASNFTALQIYAAAGGQTTDNATNGSVSQPPGIAGSFIAYMGVSGIQDTSKAVFNLSDSIDNGFVAFLHGIFAAIIYLAAAAVLLYGSYLLIARMLLLIFVLMTASLAFASYLVPSWSHSKYGWSTWWSSLFRSAVFAPLLMVFLWATLTIAFAVRSTSGTLGDLVANPTAQLDYNALFGYCIILGMLYISFKLSNSFANHIVGFDWTKAITGTAFGATLGLTGWAGRNTLGWAGRSLSDRMKLYTYHPDHPERQAGLQGMLNRAVIRSGVALKDSTFNPLKTKTGSTVGKEMGVPGMLRGKDAFGGASFGATMKGKAKKADEVARTIGPTPDQQRATRAADEGRFDREARERRRQMRETETHRKEENEQLVAQLRAEAETGARAGQPGRDSGERELTQANRELENIRREIGENRENRSSEMRILEQRAASAATEQDRNTAAMELTRVRAEHRAAEQSEAQRIRTATEAVTQRQEVVNRLNEAVTRAGDEAVANSPAGQALKEINKNLHELRESNDGRAASVEARTRADAAQSNRDRELRVKLLWDNRAAPEIGSTMRNHDRDENLKRLSALVKPEGGGDHGGGGGGH